MKEITVNWSSFIIAVATIAYVVISVFLWMSTRKNANLAKEAFRFNLFISFLEFIEKSGGLANKPGMKALRQHVMNQIYEPQALFKLWKKGFPQYYREFFDLLGFKNPEVMKIIEPNLRLEEIWPDKPGNKKGVGKLKKIRERVDDWVSKFIG